MTVTLPTKPQTREDVDPLDARVLLSGTPKGGKTTLLADWAPQTTLIIDTHRGTTLLPGEHYVEHVPNWQKFVQVVDLIVAGRHQYRTIGVDLVDDIWKFADQEAASQHGKVAAGLVEFGKGTSHAEAIFRQTVGKLFASPYGLWFISHMDSVEEQGKQRYVAKLDKRVRTYVEGACQFILMAETLGPRRQLRTQPTAKFQAGSRIPLEDPFDLDARKLYQAIAAGLKVNGKTTATT